MALMDNLISYWKMDEGSGNILDAHDSNDGVANGNPTYSQTGRINTAITLDGAGDFFEVGQPANLDVDKISISAWVKWAASPTNDETIIGRDDAINRCFTLYHSTATTFRFFVFVGGSAKIKDTSFTPTPGTWYHIVAVADGDYVRIYIDGSDVGSPTAYSGNIDKDNAELRIGGDETHGNFNGTIDEVAIWDRGLTSTEVSDLYNSGSGLAYPFKRVLTQAISDSLTLGESISTLLKSKKIKTKVTIAGTIVPDYQNLRVIRSQSKQGISSRFNLIIDSPYGRHRDDYSVGNEIKIYADKYTDPSKNIFTGIVEEVKFEGKETSQVVILRGRDYTSRLMDVTVEPIVYSNSEISTIVTNIIDNEVDNITTTNVGVTETTLKRISFNHEPVFDALKQLAELAGFIFYVDENKDLHFEKEDSGSSGITFDNTNLLKVNFDTTREGMANRVWVYGDRQLYGVKEVIPTANLTTGSIMTLLHKPRHTQVEISNFPGSLLQGGIFDMVVSPTSGPDYLVNFHDKQIVFVSGDSNGIGYNTIPGVGGSAIINYDKEIPIVKFGENRASIAAYGPKEEIIMDKSIQDPIHAKNILFKALEDSDPIDKMEGTVKGWYDLTPGQTVTLNLNDFNIINREVGILEIQYDFDKNTIHSEKVIKLRLNNKMFDVTDKIRDLFQRMKDLESQDISTGDVITRLEMGTGNFSLIGSYWEIRTRTLGSSFILGHPGTQSNPQPGGILGSVVSSGINFLGDSRAGLITQQSGGNFG